MLKPSLQLKLGQQLTMTPQLQQAIRLLQLPALELQAHIRELLETNVMLEPDEAESTGTFETLVTAAEQPKNQERSGESAVEVLDEGWGEHNVGPAETPWSGDEDERQTEYADASGQSLQDHLLWQLELASLAPRELAIARAIVDAISDDGYLTESLAEIAATLRPEIECSAEEVAHVLAGVQALDPPGVGARSVGECIELQLRQLDPATPGFRTALEIARHHLELVADRELSLLRRELRASEEELASALALVRSCHPRPGATVSAGSAEYVVPDVFVRRTDHGWGVEINPATLPRVRLNTSYASLIGRTASHASMRAQLQEARWLLKSLEIRHETLMKVARSIVERQTAFLEHGEEHMRPMILKDIAEAVAMRRAHRGAALGRGHPGGAPHGRQVPRSHGNRRLERATAHRIQTDVNAKKETAYAAQRHRPPRRSHPSAAGLCRKKARTHRQAFRSGHRRSLCADGGEAATEGRGDPARERQRHPCGRHRRGYVRRHRPAGGQT
jgi:RNA polymerase sigma-54 factor